MTYDASECTWMHLEGGCGWVRLGAVGCGWGWLGVETRCTQSFILLKNSLMTPKFKS